MSSSGLAVIGVKVAANKSCNFNSGERLTISFEPKMFDCKMVWGGGRVILTFTRVFKKVEMGLSEGLFSLKPALFAHFV